MIGVGPGAMALPTLNDVLSAAGVEQLKIYAKICSVNPIGRKAELVARLIAALTDEATLRKLWDQCTALERAAISAAVAADGLPNVPAFRAQHGTFPGERTLLFFNVLETNTKPKPYSVIMHGRFIPRDMVPVLRGFVPPPVPYRLTTVGVLPSSTGSDPATQLLPPAPTETAALHDLVATLRLVADGKLAVSAKTGRPTTAALGRLNERLLLPDDSVADAETALRSFALPLIVQAAKLVQVEDTKLALTRRGETWLRQPSLEGLRAVWDGWVSSNQFDELSRLKFIRGQQGGDTRLTKPATRRPAIVAALRQCPPGEWIAIEEFGRAMQVWGQLFDLETGDWGGLYVTGYGYGLQADFSSYWQLLSMGYVRVLLWEYAATLGLIDVAVTGTKATSKQYSRYDHLRFFRINPLGAWLLGLAPTYVPSPTAAVTAKPFVVLANLNVAVTEPAALRPNDRALLDRLTTTNSINVHKLDRPKLLQTIEDGISLDAIVEFLTSHSQQPLPPTAQTWLDDVRRNTGRVRERGAAVIFEVDDPIFARQLSNDTTLRRYCTLAGETTLVVQAADESAFRRRLRTLGYGIGPATE